MSQTLSAVSDCHKINGPAGTTRIGPILTFALWLAGCACASIAIAQPHKVVELSTGKETLIGLQLVQASNLYLLLATDGQLHQLRTPPSPATVRTLNSPFTPDSAVAMRAKLTREFGPKMEVVATKHFLIVQSKGRGKHWPEMFENLHRQFTHQMRLRGVDVRSGRFPMVAVVLPDRAALQAELDRQQISGGNIAGVYVTSSNRVYTFDGGMNESTAAVIRHEAAHQSAFNCNVHSRLNETPKWISEGLGMMFEPAAMSNASGKESGRTNERLNAEAMLLLRSRYADGAHSLSSDVRRLISGDEMFQTPAEIADAYAISWLVMHFLSERKPAQFAALLNHTAARPPFETYTPAARAADFNRIVGRSIEDTVLDIKAFMPFLR
ncbi:MAG TPA: hypothetical protein DDZ51_21625 [Planctomycetaceae bacterium]|nr:hypothetical protein [Planctomycetaceae bacterium]